MFVDWIDEKLKRTTPVRMEPQIQWTAGFKVGWEKCYDFAFSFIKEQFDKEKEQAVEEAIKREHARFAKVLNNHKKRVENADSPQAVRLFDTTREKYQRACKLEAKDEQVVYRAQLEVLGKLVGNES